MISRLYVTVYWLHLCHGLNQDREGQACEIGLMAGQRVTGPDCDKAGCDRGPSSPDNSPFRGAEMKRKSRVCDVDVQAPQQPGQDVAVWNRLPGALPWPRELAEPEVQSLCPLWAWTGTIMLKLSTTDRMTVKLKGRSAGKKSKEMWDYGSWKTRNGRDWLGQLLWISHLHPAEACTAAARSRTLTKDPPGSCCCCSIFSLTVHPCLSSPPLLFLFVSLASSGGRDRWPSTLSLVLLGVSAC